MVEDDNRRPGEQRLAWALRDQAARLDEVLDVPPDLLARAKARRVAYRRFRGALALGGGGLTLLLGYALLPWAP